MKTKKALFEGVAAVVVVLFSVSVVKADLFSADFENMAVGTALTSASPTTNGGSWTIVKAGSATVEVAADPTGGGGNVLYYKTLAAADTHLRAVLGEATSDPITLKFDYYNPTVATTNYVTLYAYDSAGTRTIYDTTVDPASRPGVHTFIGYGPGYDATSSGYVLPNDKWISVEMSFPDVSGTSSSFTRSYTITDRATGDVLYSNSSLSLAAAEDTKYFQFMSAGASTYYLDNISVVPEPMTMMVIGMGGAMFMIKRKR